MKEETYKLIKRLARCNFAPATPEKRFVRQISSLSVEAELTEKQLMYLGQIAYRYRKQMQQEQTAPPISKEIYS